MKQMWGAAVLGSRQAGAPWRARVSAGLAALCVAFFSVSVTAHAAPQEERQAERQARRAERQQQNQAQREERRELRRERLSPEERKNLRQSIQDAGRDLYRP